MNVNAKQLKVASNLASRLTQIGNSMNMLAKASVLLVLLFAALITYERAREMSVRRDISNAGANFTLTEGVFSVVSTIQIVPGTVVGRLHAEALNNCRTAKTLVLSNCTITDDFVDALAVNRTLAVLDLSEAKINEDLMHNLVSKLESVRTVNTDRCYVSDECKLQVHLIVESRR